MFVNLKVDHFIHYMPTLHLMLLCTHFKRSWIYNHYTISVAKLLCYNIFEIRIHQCNVTYLVLEWSTTSYQKFSITVLLFKCLKKIVKPLKKFHSYAWNWKGVSFFRFGCPHSRSIVCWRMEYFYCITLYSLDT